jgi:hypothetical protein
MVVGSNASVLETPYYEGIDNPLFGWAKAKYLGPFEREDLAQMIRKLGSYAGLDWEEAAIDYLLNHYGGHPMLTRLACSHAARSVQSVTRRPYTITADLLRDDETVRDLSLFEFALHILGLLQRWYPNEYRMLEMLGHGSVQDFEEMASKNPEGARHLVAYGLIATDSPRLRMPFLVRFLSADIEVSERSFAPETDNDQAKWSRIGELRNLLEPKLRRLIKRVFVSKLGVERWIDPVVSKLPEEQRKRLAGVDRDEIVQRLLLLSDLLTIIVSNWPDFSVLERGAPDATLRKDEFAVLLKYVNTHREDAHAKVVGSAEVAAVEVAVSAIAKVVDAFLLD